jgi:two-component system, chemotaxis family, CheB/CheR fusion protein
MAEPPADRDLEVLLDYLRRSRGFDFTGYKRTSLSRRIQRRMQDVGANGYLEYLDHLEVDPEEFTQLFNTILLNVTSFFRDPPAWDYLRAEILPRLVAEKDDDEPFRIWSAGCASGEEAYTLAMVAAEALGPEAVRERVKIYATDVDEDALTQARQARYTAKQVEGVPPELLERHFERNGDGYVFSKELRRSVIFGRHDLIQDAPISRVDLLVCRNTLMYLNSETQSHVLARFSFALREGGYLMLGKAEMLLTHSDLFTSLDLKRRVFRKVPGATLHERLMVLTDAGERPAGQQRGREERIRTAAMEASPEAQIVVDAGGYLTLANERARAMFKLTGDDLARPFQDLELSYRPLELRSKIQQVYVERRPSQIDEVEWPTPSGEVAHLEVQVVPLIDDHQKLLGASINFSDVTRSRRYKEELEHANQGLEDAYAELQSTNEELETTNEELQSTVEELETTNEELQSTNEELETMNEEMQATNEELQTINDELGQRTTELNQLNSFLESIWAGLDGAVAVLDPDLQVLVWNHGSEDLWGVRQEEVQGQHFLNLDIGLPIDQVRPALRAAMSDEHRSQSITLEAINRRGRAVTCRVTCSPLLDSDKTLRGVIMVVAEQPDEQPRAEPLTG